MMTLVLVVGFACVAILPATGEAQSQPQIVSPDGPPIDKPSNAVESIPPVNTSDEQPRILEIYPNPVTYRDAGEFVTLWIPPGTNVSSLELADNYATVDVPSGHTKPTQNSGTIVTYSTEPKITRELIDQPVAPLSDRLRQANDGDRIRLLDDGTVIDEVQYDRAPRSHVYDAIEGRWQPLGATNKPITSAGGGSVEAFVLPDEPERAIELLESAEEELLLAGYTITSESVVDTLIAATERNVTVRVLAEGSPVGGMEADGVAALDTLDRAGIDVRVIDGDRARYRFYHPKFAVVDDQALVTSENWKPAGTGGRSSRGWAVTTNESRIVDALTRVFEADYEWDDAIPWDEHDPTVVSGDPAAGRFDRSIPAESFEIDRKELIVAPDNAEDRLLELIESAEESIAIKQVRIGDRQFPLMQEVLEAAERGVEVRILLSSAWYVEEENRQFKRWLEEFAALGDLPITVRLADPDGEFEKIHAKGLIVDERSVLVGSMNWNNNSFQNNREVGLLLHGDDVATYYLDVFEADWKAGESGESAQYQLPLGLLIAVGLVTMGVLIVTRFIEFDIPAREQTTPREEFDQ